MKNEPEIAVADVLAHRQGFYDLLRRIFLWEMPPELFAELVAAAKREQDEDESACSHETALKNSLKEVSVNDVPTAYRDLQIEYTRLFLGPRHLPAPPYESVYRSPLKLMMQDSTMEVRSVYVKNGFQVAHLNQQPDDSIGIELEFMCALSNESIKAFLDHDEVRLAELIGTQLEFCDRHLHKWVPQFCQDIMDNTQFGFWKGAAASTRDFIERDLAELTRLKGLLLSNRESAIGEIRAAL